MAINPKTKQLIKGLARAQKHRELARFYNLNSIFGNDWAIFYAIIGARMTGKSYAVAEWMTRRKMRLGDNMKIYWLRISETSTKAMLANEADKVIDPDLKIKYTLDLKVRNFTVYNKKEGDKNSLSPFMEVIPLSQFGKLKGVGFYDKNYTGEYFIVLDEFQLEVGEKRTSFDILYNFIGMCENIARTTKSKIRVVLLGNTLEEASTILKAFNFIPSKFGRFYLKSKKCVIDNIEPTEEYLKDREGSIADILGGENMSNYTNIIKKDLESLYKGRVHKSTALIKFSKDPSDWFVLWDGKIIKRYKNNSISKDLYINMKPYLDGVFNLEKKKSIFDMFDNEVFKYDSLITYTYFKEQLEQIRKTK